MRLPCPVVLASASPRRQELLRRLVPEFEVDSADIDETPLVGERPWATAERLALEKGRVVFARHPDSLVIAGDTIVAIGDLQLGKPADAEDAANMLERLSAREHLVITGVALIRAGREEVFSVTTKVTFRALSREEIVSYVETGEPMDKAGAYAIQGGAAGFVERYEGSITNVIGFPVEEIGRRLEALRLTSL
ncbi:MAG: nucleoside triphosphate pyrophosphatase [Fimbriimonadaceae bacterium]|jgi:septum formation protein|nr:nucleoside triphosphate pyrophosphatase [Fimbriimonadaceae bacterium]